MLLKQAHGFTAVTHAQVGQRAVADRPPDKQPDKQASLVKLQQSGADDEGFEGKWRRHDGCGRERHDVVLPDELLNPRLPLRGKPPRQQASSQKTLPQTADNPVHRHAAER